MMRRFKFIKQHDGMQCGIACMAMICHHYDKKISLQDLEHECHASKDGISLKALYDLAKKIGFDTSAGKLAIEDLSNVPLPCILHWNQNHFVVLYAIDFKYNRFKIADPAKGKYTCSITELEEHWLADKHSSTSKGIALFLKPNSKFESFTKEISKDETIRSLHFLLKYFLQYKAYFLQVILGLGLGCLFQLIMPFLTQWIVDFGIKYRDISFIWLVLLGELMIISGRTAADFIRRWLLLHISMRINISLVSDFFIKLLKLPMSFFDTKLIGDLLQRIGDHERVQTFLTNQLLGVTFSLLSFIIFTIVLFVYNKLIFAIFLLGSIVYAIWGICFLNRRKILDYEIFEKQANNQNKTYQFVTTIQEIKLQDCEQRRRWEWEDAQADLFGVQMKSLRLQQTQEAGSIFINEIKNILITVFSATCVIDSQISLGTMLAIQYIIGQLNYPVDQLMQFAYSLQDMKISLERINEIHNSKNEKLYSNSLSKFPKSKSVRLKNVDFSYDKHSLKQTLDNISFEIPEGKVTAIVGASGSGKTTIIKLILGYYRVDNGQILIGSSNLNEFDLKWWRNQCGVVMQDGVIFSECIARNIAVGDSDIDLDRLKHAAQIACIDDYIESLPLKYDTIIGKEGAGLSQGQKQRILIARAVYKNPQFIFLDEATNSLDAKNEHDIVVNLSNFYNGKTVIVVAHRLSTVKNADNIIVVNSGKIVESGTHQELIDAKGSYYNLIKNQLELGN